MLLASRTVVVLVSIPGFAVAASAAHQVQSCSAPQKRVDEALWSMTLLETVLCRSSVGCESRGVNGSDTGTSHTLHGGNAIAGNI